MKIIYSLIALVFCNITFSNEVNAQSKKSEYIEIEIHTGEEHGAGTDMDISLFFYYDLEGSALIIDDISQYINGNALERGTVNKFSYLSSVNAEYIKLHVEVKNPTTTRIDDDWYLEKIILREKDGTKYTFPFNRWIGHWQTYRSHSDDPIITNEKTQASDWYNMPVEVHTGDLSGAGTNANVYLILHTEKGNGPPIKLNTRISGDAFEQGDIDKFTMDYDYFEELKYINIRHDNKGAGSAWYLKEIRITTPDDKVMVFGCNCWMEGDENGKSIDGIVDTQTSKKIYFQSAIDGKYLDIQWGSPKNNTPIHLWTGNMGVAQQFTLEPADAGYYYIKSELGAHKYLHVLGGSTEAQAKVVLYDGKGNNNAKWAFEKIPDSDYYLIKSRMGTYLDVQWANSKDGTPIWMWTKNSGKAQQWKIVTKKDGELKSINLSEI